MKTTRISFFYIFLFWFFSPFLTSCHSELLLQDLRPFSRSTDPYSTIKNNGSSSSIPSSIQRDLNPRSCEESENEIPHYEYEQNLGGGASNILLHLPDSYQTFYDDLSLGEQQSPFLAQSIEDVHVIQNTEDSSFDVVFEFRENLESQQVTLSALSFNDIQPTTDLEFNGSRTKGQENIPYSSRSTWRSGSFSETHFLSVYCKSSSSCDEMTFYLQKRNEESDALEEEVFVLYSHHEVNIRRELISGENETLDSIYALMNLASQKKIESFLIPPDYGRSKLQLWQDEDLRLFSLDLKFLRIRDISFSACYKASIFKQNNVVSLDGWDPPNELEPFYVHYPISSDEPSNLESPFEGLLKFNILVPNPSDSLSFLSRFTVIVEPEDTRANNDDIIEDNTTLLTSTAATQREEALPPETCEEVRYTIQPGNALSVVANQIKEGNFELFGELSQNQHNLFIYLKDNFNTREIWQSFFSVKDKNGESVSDLSHIQPDYTITISCPEEPIPIVPLPS